MVDLWALKEEVLNLNWNQVGSWSEMHKEDKLEALQVEWSDHLEGLYDSACEEYLLARYKLVKAHKDVLDDRQLHSKEWAKADKNLADLLIDPELPE